MQTNSNNSINRIEQNYIEKLESLLPELKNVEGFPIATDKDILELSLPPYFTCCPNPFIKDFIDKNGKIYDESKDVYYKEPFIGDISEGKTETVYNVHSYHTKVPYKAIMKYIEHYTEEGDLVLDAFCGTGMAGVATNICNRKAILSDLSPIAAFISFNYNNLIDSQKFYNEAIRILKEVDDELGWMFETIHSDGQSKGKVNSVIWSDILISPYSNEEFIFYDVAFDSENGIVNEEFIDPHTGAKLVKRECKRATVEIYDEVTKKKIVVTKQVPVLINYTVNRKKYSKKPDTFDMSLIDKIKETNIPYWFPITPIPEGDKTRELTNKNIIFAHQLYTKRILYILSALKNRCNQPILNLWFSSHLINLSILNRYRPEVSFPYNPFSGTIYLASMSVEANVFTAYLNKAKNIAKAFLKIKDNSVVSVCSATNLQIANNTIDYIFTDPPFGQNLMYSELNFIWEAWLKIFTNNKSEAIINKTQRKNLSEYYDLMLQSFKEYYRVLKPKRWITVIFHNSKSSVWNAIQEGMSKSGFIVSQVTVLDKKQGSFNQVTAAGATKSDLVISAFKPTQEFERNFLKQAGGNLEVDFVREFLLMQPKRAVIERTDKMLYSKMLAYYIQRGYEIRYDAKSFYHLLSKHFVQEDGFWFISDQINTYIEYKKKMKLEGLDEVKSGAMMLFITDEKSAILWLFNFLSDPRTFAEVHTAFTQLANIQGDEVPELREMLEENFVNENGSYRRPLNETEYYSIADRREKTLMREFEALLIKAQTEKGKIKSVRTEALVFGFECCYKARRFHDILSVSIKLDKSILENSSELNDFVGAAEIMVKGVS
jgi:DNA modification methylase